MRQRNVGALKLAGDERVDDRPDHLGERLLARLLAGRDVSVPSEGSIEEPLTVLADLQRQGLIGHIGLSNVTPKQLAEGQTIAEIVCVQNFYNLAHRNDDRFVDDLAGQRIAYVPFFPAGRLHGAAVISPQRGGGCAARHPATSSAILMHSDDDYQREAESAG